MTKLSRRGALAAMGAMALGCTREAKARREDVAPSASSVASAPPQPSAPPPRPLPHDAIDVRELAFDAAHGGPQKAILVVPAWTRERLPVLVALHGRGEAQKGMEAGAWGWVHDYWLDKAMKRLRNPPLVAADFQGFVEPSRLEKLNASLADRPFRGVVVACPYTPDLLAEKTLDNAGPFGAFVVDRLLPRVLEETGASSSRASTGIDGVSLGGRAALLVGFAHADRFGAIGTLQAAIQLSEAKELAHRAKRALSNGPFALRLVTSERDFYKDEIGALHRELDRASVPNEHLVLPGPHDYPFNRGPGAIEMLLFHDRALRGEPPV